MKDIKGYEGLYAVTVDGKVWSYSKPCSSKNGLLVEYTEKQIKARRYTGQLTGKMNGAKALRKLSMEDAQDIKKMWNKTKCSFASLGRQYNVTPQTIAKICYDKSYQFEVT